MPLKKPLIFVIALVIVGFTACTKDNFGNNKTTTKKDTTTTITTPGVDVYVAGSITSTQSIPVATYWKNGVAHALADSSSESYTYAMTVADTDVYIAGIANNAATYWKNGKANTLSGSMALGITVSGGDVYVAGVSTIAGGTSVATYWKNGNPVTLTDNVTPSVAVSIAVVGNDVYVAGYLAAAGNNNTVCYWKNGAIQTPAALNSTSTFGISPWGAVGLAVVGSDVYITGAVENTTDTQVIATYWKNTTPTALTTDGAQISSAVNAVTTNGTDIYYAGYDDAMATYWLNGTAYHLNPNSQQFVATGIAVTPDTYATDGMDVYVAGYSGYGTTHAVYWKNGTVKTLSTRMSTTCGIGVVKH